MSDAYSTGCTTKECSEKRLNDDRCPFCGHPEYEEIQENGHYRTLCCKQITEGCCNGESCG